MWAIIGSSISGRSSFDTAFVSGKNLVPNPPAGITVFLLHSP